MASQDMDTSAGRVASILERFATHAPDTKAADAWMNALNVKDVSHLLTRIGELDGLLRELFREVHDLPDDEDPQFLLDGIQPLSRLSNKFLNVAGQKKSGWDDVVTPRVIFGVHACSRALRRAGLRLPVIEKSDLQALLEDVQKWIAAVSQDPNLEPTNKLYLIHRLRAVESALLGFFITGFEGVEQAVAALAGSAVVREFTRNRSFLEQVGQFWQRVVGVAQGTKAISDTAHSTIKAIDAITTIAE